MEKYMGIPVHRTFGGKKYDYHRRFRTKGDASTEARFLRGKGIQARVISTPKAVAKHHPDAKYLLYSKR